MRKVLLAALGIIAGIAVLGSLHHLIGILISVAIVYTGLHFYLKTNSTIKKIWWGIVGFIGTLACIANFPGLIGFIALVGIYFIYKNWNKTPSKNIFTSTQENDPFTNFEKEWENIKKNKN